MFYQLRLAEEKDINVIEAFLKEAGTSHKGIEENRSQFIMMEDPPNKIVACLGMEELENEKGLLRSLVVSDKLSQGHIVSLFQGMQVLCEKRGIHTLYLVANNGTSMDFLEVMGFKRAGSLPEELCGSEHVSDSLNVSGAVLMVKTPG
ncbi:hypothetical protein P9D34_02140 [Bacillus swezeyi]|uniref:N-acetyltransferase domain-containing protein n=1 Tax=Bacillus swezeyi TaxID=1925020 RepID=A0A1R1S132_9BACI|nr:hypothetical protein [Bacillus swezeyi]MEC1259261.1 hypothetical protein [Bacillus swezeyi]MED1740586.1 hypothetical protein [Bacillus swezeyi]MED2927777.1 hypothetical protein [Bacillus swezeyi]MED2942036.1 hypothetical protein [Bacillus swezeyi]MED2965310.1 hypothetical protein [Bacillus swezeyi]